MYTGSSVPKWNKISWRRMKVGRRGILEMSSIYQVRDELKKRQVSSASRRSSSALVAAYTRAWQHYLTGTREEPKGWFQVTDTKFQWLYRVRSVEERAWNGLKVWRMTNQCSTGNTKVRYSSINIRGRDRRSDPRSNMKQSYSRGIRSCRKLLTLIASIATPSRQGCELHCDDKKRTSDDQFFQGAKATEERAQSNPRLKTGNWNVPNSRGHDNRFSSTCTCVGVTQGAEVASDKRKQTRASNKQVEWDQRFGQRSTYQQISFKIHQSSSSVSSCGKYKRRVWERMEVANKATLADIASSDSSVSLESYVMHYIF